MTIVTTNTTIRKHLPPEIVKAAKKILKGYNVPDDQIEVWIKNQPELLAQLQAAYWEEVRK